MLPVAAWPWWCLGWVRAQGLRAVRGLFSAMLDSDRHLRQVFCRPVGYLPACRRGPAVGGECWYSTFTFTVSDHFLTPHHPVRPEMMVK